MAEPEYVFADGFEGPLVRWSIVDGAVHKDGRRVLTLSRVREALVNNLNGRVRVREVRLKLDDDSIVSFGSYGGSILASPDGYAAFKSAFFSALADAAPDVPVNAEAAVLPKFVFGLFVLGIGLLFAIIGISKANVAVLVGGVVVATVGGARAFHFRPWGSDRFAVPAAEFATHVSKQSI